MPRILAKIVNLAAKRTETLTGKTWTDNDSNTRYAADVIAHFEDAAGKVPGDVGYLGPIVVPKNESGVVQSAGTQTDPIHINILDMEGRTPTDAEYTGLMVAQRDLTRIIDTTAIAPPSMLEEYDSTDINTNEMTVGECDGIDIYNYGNTSFTITINSKTFTIHPNIPYNDLIFKTRFTSITFSAGAANFQLFTKEV